ncbi:MAG TPA: septation protein IspZ [Phenylobacterium sp.]|uniref:inner membrane-spanning protein YciB n=1 Tax=Phenylobacterium sp. TaxID=1871053 RepID=UPI002B48FDCD|nr:septation protein IspZ [Phenylobacterium sp.]HKR90541.1 septation protein IspZ [Phenylobacterium sp.]
MNEQSRRWVRGFVDYAGLAFFVIALAVTRNLVQATWGLVVGAAAAVVVGLVFERRIPPMALATAVMAIIFGSLTLVLHDARFIKMKPTILYVGFAGFLFAGLARGKNPLRTLMGDTFHLPDPVVRVLTLRYAIFFLALAGANEVARHVLGDVGWGYSKLAAMGAVFVFTLAQMPLILKHTPDPSEEPPAAG